jgi:tRNA (adenine22-N1)-methyltransferase
MTGLDKRLATVASFVRAGSRLADIGTDHAYLPTALVHAGHCPSAIASDIGEGPAAAARRTVSAAGLDDRIDVRVGDGLCTVAPDEADDIVIAGMGGENIADILAAAPWVRQKHIRLILQPMSRPEKLRQALLQDGFAIEEETVVADGKHLYLIMCCTYIGCAVTPTERACYVGQLPHTPEAVRFIERQQKRLYDRMCGIQHQAEAAEEYATLCRAAQVMRDWIDESL